MRCSEHLPVSPMVARSRTMRWNSVEGMRTVAAAARGAWAGEERAGRGLSGKVEDLLKAAGQQRRASARPQHDASCCCYCCCCCLLWQHPPEYSVSGMPRFSLVMSISLSSNSLTRSWSAGIGPKHARRQARREAGGGACVAARKQQQQRTQMRTPQAACMVQQLQHSRGAQHRHHHNRHH